MTSKSLIRVCVCVAAGAVLLIGLLLVVTTRLSYHNRVVWSYDCEDGTKLRILQTHFLGDAYTYHTFKISKAGKAVDEGSVFYEIPRGEQVQFDSIKSKDALTIGVFDIKGDPSIIVFLYDCTTGQSWYEGSTGSAAGLLSKLQKDYPEKNLK